MNTQVDKIYRGDASFRIDEFQAAVLGLPEKQKVMHQVTNYFGPNIYLREMAAKAGDVVVGRSHKEEHLFSLVSGVIIVVDEDGVRTKIAAPMVYRAKKGRKIIYIIEDARFQNIWSTSETNVEKLEAELAWDDNLVVNPKLLNKEY
mgnify:CR=1 FL=1|tara:strand:- start:1547 stop:1987 length:441 start_codon:yes stop_codon:yes gene_type:complete